MSDEAKHKDYLGRLCRVCGEKVAKKSWYTPKLVAECIQSIKDIFGVDLSNDNQDDYPSKVCHRCNRGFSRWKAGPTAPKLANFTGHTTPCDVCSKFQCNANKSESVVDRLKVELPKLSFVLVPQNKDTCTRFVSFNGLSPKFAVEVQINGVWDLYVHGLKVSKEVLYSSFGLTNHLVIGSIPTLIQCLKSVQPCEGNAGFDSLIKSRFDIRDINFKANDGEPIAHLENKDMIELNEGFSTIRHINCDRVVFPKKGSSLRCNSCSVYRRSLIVAARRSEKEKQVGASSNCRYDFNNKEELRNRLYNVQADRQTYKTRSEVIQARLKEAIEKESIPVSMEIEDLIKETLVNTTPDENVFTPGSPQHFLWTQQVEQAKKADARGMRWHPLMIRWCLAIRYKSPAAYRQLRNSGFLALPSESTLKKYEHFTKPTSGFNEDIIECLLREANMGEIQDFQRNVSLVYDEMKISAGLVYSKGNGKLRGFTESGDINDEVEAFHRKIEEGDKARPLATYVNVFMVRGLFSKLSFAFGYFAGLGFTSAKLFPLVWKATEILESVGFYVRCFVSDGASPNRKFYKIHGGEELTYKTTNVHSPDRQIYFISDPPHLIKTARNNLENSHGHNNTRNLMV